MDCPYLGHRPNEIVCNASVKHLAPDSLERAERCETEEHYRCLTLLGFVLRGEEPIAALN